MIAWKDIYGYNNCMEVHRHVLELLPEKAIVVEVGVAYGRGLALLAELRREMWLSFRLVGVDNFVNTEYMSDCGYANISRDDTIQRLAAVGVPPDSYNLIESDSVDAANTFAGGVDYVFIDAAHQYEAVIRDIKAWNPCVVSGGFIGGHDWDMEGVRQAVTENFTNPIIFEKDYCNSWLVRKE